MRIAHLSLTNFRNYARLELDLESGITLFQGDNAQGKSNLLEAVYYLATSRSPQANSDAELVNWLVRGDLLAVTRVMADVYSGDRKLRIELVLAPMQAQPCNSPSFRKQIRINGVVKRAMDLLGLVTVVLFRPYDIELVANAPAERRRYLDIMLCQLNSHYCRALQTYNRVLNQRNCLLRLLRERGGDEGQLDFWDAHLADFGVYLTACRSAAVAQLSHFAQPIHAHITDGREVLSLVYQPSLATLAELPRGAQDVLLRGAEPIEVKDALSAEILAFRESLRRLRREELARGVTLLGPHRDDFRFLSADVDLNVYGSRGQQRTAALALKLAETEVMRLVKNEWPILLLDDFLSELDDKRRRKLLELTHGTTQILMTTTEADALGTAFPRHFAQYRIIEGTLHPVASISPADDELNQAPS